ncbi:hypothetical protein ACIA8E_36910 [Streptomyces sp. NPDC051664]|uniref:hypothetical protein n=1 Tax=Streptomyces sp. NPDC051664 TaxID=3365668 RepID=UPI0037AE6694
MGVARTVGGKRLDPELKKLFFERLHAVGSVSPVARELGLNLNTAFTLARKAGMNYGHLGHPGREEYLKLRARGVSRREAAERVGAHPRTALDWDRGIRKSSNSRIYPDGRRVNYTTGTVTMSGVITTAPARPVSLKSLEKKLHPRSQCGRTRPPLRPIRRTKRSGGEARQSAAGRRQGRARAGGRRRQWPADTTPGSELEGADRAARRRRQREQAAPGRQTTKPLPPTNAEKEVSA